MYKDYEVYDDDSEEDNEWYQVLKEVIDNIKTKSENNNLPSVCTMSITSSEIELHSTWAHPYDLTGDDNYQELPGCLIPDCVIYCSHSALLRKDMKVNKLGNPIIDEHWLTLMVEFGGPVGYLIVARKDGTPLPWMEIERMYKDYKVDDDNDEENKWYDVLKEAMDNILD